MNDYDSIDIDKKQVLKNQLIKNATSIGGKNHFLSLIESIRMARPHPLLAKDASFRFNKGSIKWGKVIFKDKVNLLMSIANGSNMILMPERGDSNYKIIRNLINTISPIKFEVKPKNTKDGNGFTFEFVKKIDTKNCQLSFMFEVLFILPIKSVKKIYIGQ